MKTKIILDGTFQVHRAMYKGMNMKDSQGRITGAIVIFLRMLWNFRELGDPIVVFDWVGSRAKFRKNLHQGYKVRTAPANEEEVKEKQEKMQTLLFSHRVLQDMLPKMGIPVIVLRDQEGDDVVFRVAQGLTDQEVPLWIASDDEDYIQFLEMGVRVFQPMKDIKWDTEKFETGEKYGFPISHFTMYKAMIGDSSDKIEGIKGIGVKTAARIMKELPEATYPALFEYANSGDKGIHKKLREGFALVKRNMLLIDLKNIPLTKEEVMDEYNLALSRAVVDVNYVVEQFKSYDFKSFGNWLSYLMTRK